MVATSPRRRAQFSTLATETQTRAGGFPKFKPNHCFFDFLPEEKGGATRIERAGATKEPRKFPAASGGEGPAAAILFSRVRGLFLAGGGWVFRGGNGGEMPPARRAGVSAINDPLMKLAFSGTKVHPNSRPLMALTPARLQEMGHLPREVDSLEIMGKNYFAVRRGGGRTPGFSSTAKSVAGNLGTFAGGGRSSLFPVFSRRRVDPSRWLGTFMRFFSSYLKTFKGKRNFPIDRTGLLVRSKRKNRQKGESR